MDDDLAAGVEFAEAFGQFVHRNQVSAEVADLVLVRLAHLEHEQVIAGIEPPLQFLGGHRPN
jgi:hypothetical protein